MSCTEETQDKFQSPGDQDWKIHSLHSAEPQRNGRSDAGVLFANNAAWRRAGRLRAALFTLEVNGIFVLETLRRKSKVGLLRRQSE